MIHDIFLTTDVKYLSKNPHMGVRLRPPLSSINEKLYLLSNYCSISIATLRRDEVHLLRVSSHVKLTKKNSSDQQ